MIAVEWRGIDLLILIELRYIACAPIDLSVGSAALRGFERRLKRAIRWKAKSRQKKLGVSSVPQSHLDDKSVEQGIMQNNAVHGSCLQLMFGYAPSAENCSNRINCWAFHQPRNGELTGFLWQECWRQSKIKCVAFDCIALRISFVVFSFHQWIFETEIFN